MLINNSLKTDMDGKLLKVLLLLAWGYIQVLPCSMEGNKVLAHSVLVTIPKT